VEAAAGAPTLGSDPVELDARLMGLGSAPRTAALFGQALRGDDEPVLQLGRGQELWLATQAFALSPVVPRRSFAADALLSLLALNHDVIDDACDARDERACRVGQVEVHERRAGADVLGDGVELGEVVARPAPGLQRIELGLVAYFTRGDRRSFHGLNPSNLIAPHDARGIGRLPRTSTGR
jgi:hypothetical protein